MSKELDQAFADLSDNFGIFFVLKRIQAQHASTVGLFKKLTNRTKLL
jgi:hypothetical protein